MREVCEVHLAHLRNERMAIPEPRNFVGYVAASLAALLDERERMNRTYLRFGLLPHRLRQHLRAADSR